MLGNIAIDEHIAHINIFFGLNGSCITNYSKTLFKT